MIWTEREESVLEQCRSAVKNCAHYNIRPAPWFELCISMHGALLKAGLIKTEKLDMAVCAGCVHAVEGGCERYFENAAVSREEQQVLFCPAKLTAGQLEASRARAKRTPWEEIKKREEKMA